jgi:uncharacterized protein (TIGR03435 family)
MRTSERSRSIVLAAMLLLQPNRGYGQPSQYFEVAVIRPSQVATGAGTSFGLFEGGRLRITNEPVRLLIRLAFRLQDAQIVGGPAWIETDRYDIEAKTALPEKIRPDHVGPLMQSLLADRFNLKFHRETQEMKVYALVVAKDGPKLKPPTEGEASGANTSGGPHKSHLIATATTMEVLAGYVGNRLNRIVVDKTGLKDSFDFTLDWAPDEAPDSLVPPLITALREQLGLRLETQKVPVEVLVIDGIARPSDN